MWIYIYVDNFDPHQLHCSRDHLLLALHFLEIETMDERSFQALVERRQSLSGSLSLMMQHLLYRIHCQSEIELEHLDSSNEKSRNRLKVSKKIRLRQIRSSLDCSRYHTCWGED